MLATRTLLVLLLVGALSAAADPLLMERLQGPCVAGHRGTGLRVDGNTIEGFDRALAQGAQVIETDLQVTLDGVPVISHDAKIHTAHGRGKKRIAEMTLAEVRACRIHGRFAVPTFEEVLQWSAGRVVVNAEFKTKASIAPALALVKKYDAYEWTYFQTQADPERYRIARIIDTKVALLFKVTDENALNWALSQNDKRLMVLSVEAPMRRPDVIERIHAAGKLVSEDASDFGLLGELLWQKCHLVFAAGVDISVTDHPCDCLEAATALQMTSPPSTGWPRTGDAMLQALVCTVVSFGAFIMLLLRYRVHIREKLAWHATP